MELTLRDRKRIKNGLPAFADGDVPAYLSNGADSVGVKTDNLSWYNTTVPSATYVPQWYTTPNFYKVKPLIQMEQQPGVLLPAELLTQMKDVRTVNPLVKPIDTIKSVGTPLNYDKIGGALLATAGAAGDIVDAHKYNKSVDQLLNEAGERLANAAGTGYTWLNDPEYQRELAEVRRSNNANTFKAIGSGAAAGGAIGSIFGPVGGLIGAGAGALVGTIGGLFGGSSRRKLAYRKLQQAEMNAKIRNDFNRDSALTQSIRQLNALEESPYIKGYRYEDGKTPVYSAAGLIDKVANSKVSNGEVIVNFKDGYAFEVPGKPNNKDTKYAWLRASDGVIPNKHGLAAYAKTTGDYAGAMEMTDMFLRQKGNSYKCGKLPRFKEGTPVVDPMTSIIPSVFGGIAGLYQYFDAHNLNIFSPNTNKLNLYAQDAFAALNEIKNNPYPTLWQLREAEARTRNALDSSGGLGAGLKMLARIAQLGVTQSQWAKALADTQAYNNAQKMAVNNLKISTGESGANRSVQTDQWDKDYMSKAHAARQQGEQVGIYNFKNALDTYYGMRFKENQLARMLGLYEQNQALDLARFNRDIANSNSNSTVAGKNFVDALSMYNKYLTALGYR